MTDRRTVYVVTTGEYSDYAVQAVYEREEDAQACAHRIGGDVEGYPLYPPGDDSFRERPRHYAHVDVNADGTFREEIFEWSSSDLGDYERGLEADVIKVGAHHPDGPWFRVTTHAPTPAQAAKAARERAAQVSAALIEGRDPAARNTKL